MGANLSEAIPELQQFGQALVDLAGRAGVLPRVTSVLRTHSQQQRLYEAFLRGETQYPVAPPGSSAHEFGYAFDMIADSRQNLHDLGTVWRRWGGVWSPQDEVHFEYPGFNPTTAEAPSLAQCGPIEKLMAEAIDLVLPVGKTLGMAELIASLVGLGFPRSRVLRFLSSPVTYLACQ